MKTKDQLATQIDVEARVVHPKLPEVSTSTFLEQLGRVDYALVAARPLQRKRLVDREEGGFILDHGPADSAVVALDVEPKGAGKGEGPSGIAASAAEKPLPAQPLAI